MKYNIEKINGIAEKLSEIIEEAIAVEDQTEIKIGAVEMALRESLREIGEKRWCVFWKMRIRNGKASPRLSAHVEAS